MGIPKTGVPPGATRQRRKSLQPSPEAGLLQTFLLLLFILPGPELPRAAVVTSEVQVLNSLVCVLKVGGRGQRAWIQLIVFE